MAPSVNSLPLRRNGKAACEPCRRAKAACDHTWPTCNRCVRREVASKCIYLPAPSTKPPNPDPETAMQPYKIAKSYQLQRSSATTTNIRSISRRAEIRGNGSGGGAQEPQRSSSTPSNLRSISRQAEICAYDSGGSPAEFLGPTSYSSVFRDNKANVGEDYWNSDQDEPKAMEPVASKDDYDHQQSAQNAAERLRLGIEILKHFPERRLCERFNSRQCPIADVELHGPSINYFHASIWSTYEKYLCEPRDPELLAIMAARVLRNQHMPLSTFRSTREWLNCFAGEQLRWETLGILFAVSGVSAMIYTDWDPPLALNGNNGLDRRQYAQRMIECAEQCLVLCDDCGVVNEFVIWLMHSIQSLQLMLSGGASKCIVLCHLLPYSRLVFVKALEQFSSVFSAFPRIIPYI